MAKQGVPMSKHRHTCRVSGKPLTPILNLGDLFISGFYQSRDVDAPRAPLELGIGQESGLLQLCHTVNPDSVFRQYWYRSGTNATMARQLREIVDAAIQWVHLEDGDIVLDIGCNDGTLLSLYPLNLGLERIGIDPALNLAESAKKHCEHHATEYFNQKTFFGLSNGKRAKIVTSIAMFYDLENPGSFVKAIYDCLREDGIWIIQMQYTPLMFLQNAFDNIVHEHLEFYTALSLQYLLKRYDLKILDVDLNDVNAGSFRVIVSKNTNPVLEAADFTKEIGEFRRNSVINYEKTMHIEKEETLRKFQLKIQELKSKTGDLLYSLRKKGKKVYGYGASTKGNTLLQYYEITTETIPAIAERQPQKFGLLTAGTWIPIISEMEMREQKPDYLFVLPWHFIHEFRIREQDFLKGGGKFIVPLPELRIIG